MREAPLGELIERVRRPIDVQPDALYYQIGIRSHGRGVFLKDAVTGAELKNKRVFWLEPGDLVFNIVFAWEGAVAVVGPTDRRRCGSHRFPTYLARPGVCTVEFLRLFFQTPTGLRLLGLASPGSAGRNRTLNQGMLLGMSVPAPTLAEQRRIVDLIAAIDTCHRRALSLWKVTTGACDSVREAALADAAIASLGDLLLDIEGGRSPLAEDRLPSARERAVLKVSAVKPGLFDAAEVKTLGPETSMPEHARLRDGDVLMTRANTSALVGAACRVRSAPPNYFLCDKTLRLVPAPTMDPDHLVQVLLSRVVRDQLSNAATGTSGSMKNISQEKIRSLKVPLLVPADQRRLSQVLEGITAVADGARLEASCLAALRTTLSSELLAGSYEIPAAYDALLQVS
jgi:type I restriction enzyme S subunit